MSNQKRKTIAWTANTVEIVLEAASGALMLQKAGDKSNPDLTFAPGEEASIFATLRDSGLPISTKALVLHGAETYEGSDFPRPIEALIEQAGKNWPVAYMAEQLAAKSYKPTGYALRLAFYKPQLWVFCNGFTLSNPQAPKAAPLAIKRVDANAKPVKAIKRSDA
jgi:hypothetical protein